MKSQNQSDCNDDFFLDSFSDQEAQESPGSPVKIVAPSPNEVKCDVSPSLV